MSQIGAPGHPVLSHDAVHHAVTPRASAAVEPALHALAAKACSFERVLLSKVLDLGASLDSFGGRGAEQILAQLPLGLRPDAAPAMLLEDRDSELEVA